MMDVEKMRIIGENAARLGKELDQICPGGGSIIAGAIVARILATESPADISAALIATAQILKKREVDEKMVSHLFFEPVKDFGDIPAETARALRALAKRGFAHHVAEELEIISLALPSPLIEKDGEVLYGEATMGYPRGVQS